MKNCNYKYEYPRTISNKWGKDLKISIIKKGRSDVFRLRYYLGKTIKYLHRNTEEDICHEAQQLLDQYETGDVAGGGSDSKLLQYYESSVQNGTLLEAIQFWNTHHAKQSISFRDAFAEYMQTKKKMSRKHYIDQQGRFKKLEHLNATPVNEITTHDLEMAISKITHRTTRKNYKKSFAAFLHWCVTKGYVNQINNQVASDGIFIAPETREERAEQVRKNRVLTPEEFTLILQHVSFDLKIQMILIGLMGVRTEEALRITMDHINLEENEIWLSGDITKTNKEREVQICPQLKKLIKKLPTEGPIIQKTSHQLWKERLLLCREIELDWPHNALRRSFVSYQSKLKGNQQTAKEAGHGVAVLQNTYRRQITRQNAVDWFNIKV